MPFITKHPVLFWCGCASGAFIEVTQVLPYWSGLKTSILSTEIAATMLFTGTCSLAIVELLNAYQNKTLKITWNDCCISIGAALVAIPCADIAIKTLSSDVYSISRPAGLMLALSGVSAALLTLQVTR